MPRKDLVADGDGVQTARLREAGAVLIGLTASPEFGSTAHTRTFLHGTTRNPWNLERTPGGSSGGSAAAVAAAILPVASGSDGGGSIRIPASYSGLFGAKGTYGRIPKGGVESSYTTAYGCMSRSVRDAARWWDCVVGAHELDPYSLPHPGIAYEAVMSQAPPSGLRVAWSQDLGYGTCASEVARVAREAADALVDAAGMTWTDRPVELKDMSVGWGLLNHPGSWLLVRDYWPDRADDFTPPIRAGIADAERRFNVREYARAIERRDENNRILSEAFEDIDVLITPTTATTAFRAEGPMPSQIDGRDIKPMHAITFTYPFNVSGHPGFSLPCGLDADGLPVGLQLVARRHRDDVLFQLSHLFEQIRPWQKIAPNYAA